MFISNYKALEVRGDVKKWSFGGGVPDHNFR